MNYPTSDRLDHIVTQLRAAADDAMPSKQVINTLRDIVADPGALAEQLPQFDDDDVVLFEDDSVSIWHVRFVPGVHVPPHDHQLSVFIGVYAGTEINHFYQADSDELRCVKTQHIRPGDVTSIGKDGIHSVVAEGAQPSCAIHVYFGRLTTVERSLFDWDTGKPVLFNDENFESMTRIESTSA